MKPSEIDIETILDDEDSFYSTSHFHHMLRVEQKRTSRSEKPFLLMLLDISGLKARHRNGYIFERIKGTLVSYSRETDIRGWYEPYRVMGVIFTEMSSIDKGSIKKIFTKISGALSETCGDDVVKAVKISLAVFRFPDMKNKQLMVSGF